MERQKEGSLAGKVVIITGASRGVGRQAAIDFVRHGARVVLAARTAQAVSDLPGSLGEALSQIEAADGEAITVPTDLSHPADLERLVETACERFGGVDILVNNAAATTGSMWSKRFLDLTREEWLYQFDVNVHAPFTLMQLVVPIMEARGGGRILNVTTGSAEVMREVEEPPPLESLAGRDLCVPGYFASKRALDRLGSVVAPDLLRRNIYVIGVMPGWVATELVRERMENIDELMAAEGDGPRPVPPEVPSRMLVYFAACENPREYTGRLFFAEREMTDMGISLENA